MEATQEETGVSQAFTLPQESVVEGRVIQIDKFSLLGESIPNALVVCFVQGQDSLMLKQTRHRLESIYH